MWCRIRSPAALCLCFHGPWLAASPSRARCASFCLSQLRSGEDEDALGQVIARLLPFHARSPLHFHAWSPGPAANLSPFCFWHRPFAVLCSTKCWMQIDDCRFFFFPSSPVHLVPQEAGSQGKFISVSLFLAWCFWPRCWRWLPLWNPMVWGGVTRQVHVCVWVHFSRAFILPVPDVPTLVAMTAELYPCTQQAGQVWKCWGLIMGHKQQILWRVK